MKRLYMTIAFALITLSAHAENTPASQGVVTISITNIEEGSGTVYIALLNSADGWLKSSADAKPFRDLSATITSTDDIQLRVEDLPPGQYAISLFQDLDGDGEMDTNFIGFPKEPFGFSAPMGKFGPPDFEEAAFDFTGVDIKVEVSLN